MTRRALPLLLLALVMATPARAQWRSEVKLQDTAYANRRKSLDASLGQRRRSDRSMKLRLMWAHAFGRSGWRLDSAYQLDADQGGQVRLERQLRRAYPALAGDTQARNGWPLSRRISDSGAHRASQRLDRLSLDYAGAHLVLRLGRQALTWGGGLVFRPMDLFNPFAPDATDTEYKPGSDMLYGQWLFGDGSDLQAVVVPRRNVPDRTLSGADSAGGLKWHGQLGPGRSVGLDLMLARDGWADVLGAALAGPWGGASWTLEAVPTRLRDGRVRTSLLANLQVAWSWRGRGVSGYAEVFRNGFGVGDRRPLQALPPALLQRLARGELFTVSRHYLALGANVQYSPLLALRPALIGNLDDGSALLNGQAEYSLSQTLGLTTGIIWPLGGHGSEYGGRVIAAGLPVHASPARSVYVRLTWYP